MYKFKFIPLDYKNNLCEVRQDTHTKFAFARIEGKDLVQVTPLALCRDFLNDVVISKYLGKTVSIYGFTYDYAKANYQEDFLMLLFEMPEKHKAHIKDVLYILNDIEIRAGLVPTEINAIEGRDNLFMLQADKVWQATTMTISLYSLLLRALVSTSECEPTFEGFMDTVTRIWDDTSNCPKIPEVGLLGRVLTHLDIAKLVLNIKAVVGDSNPLGTTSKTFTVEKDRHQLHDQSGILAFSYIVKTLLDNKSTAPLCKIGEDWALNYVKLEAA